MLLTNEIMFDNIRMNMWFWITVWIIILIFNTIHSFLPTKLQGEKWIRLTAMIVASIILVRGIYQEIDSYCHRVFAYISMDGTILESRNFPWEINKIKTKEGDIIFIIEGRYGDASLVSIVPDKPIVKYEIYNSVDGVAVKFVCPEEEIPDFKINIKM